LYSDGNIGTLGLIYSYLHGDPNEYMSNKTRYYQNSHSQLLFYIPLKGITIEQ